MMDSLLSQINPVAYLFLVIIGFFIVRTLRQMSNGGPNQGSGTIYGSETHTQSQAEQYPYTPSLASGGGYVVGTNLNGCFNANGQSCVYGVQSDGTQHTLGGVVGLSSNGGSDSPINIMNPFAVVNYIIRYQ